MDLLVAWGVAQAAGFVFKPILQELSNIAKDAAKDWTKDLLKSIPNGLLKRLQKEEIDVAVGKALKEFLLLVQQELCYADLEDEELKQFIKPFRIFIGNKEIKEILGNAFTYECEVLDTKKLEAKWYELDLKVLPDEFNWKRIGKHYQKKVKAIIRESPELRNVLDSQNLEVIKDNTQATAGIIPDFDLNVYQEGIRERYGKLQLDSLDTSGYAYNDLKLWQIFIVQNVREIHSVLPQVHEIPKEHLKRLRESQQAELEIEEKDLERYKKIYFEQPIRSVLEIANNKQNHKYAVILGDPGSGKSTLLQFLALNWASSPLSNLISQPIPLLIELRTYIRRRDEKECNNFLEFFHKCSGVIHHLNQHQLQIQLKKGNALVMFDGLDEVFNPAKREDVITDIHCFTNKYPNVQIIVTSRIIGYKPQRLRDAEFKHFILQDLELEQIQDFIHRWHELTFNDEADKIRKKERLLYAIKNSSAIQELAGNPLLLTMMAILNRNQELPRDRTELYNQASRVLLHQWDVERTLVEDKRLDPTSIDCKDKQAMLRQVAYFMQTSDKSLAGNLIKESDLERILKKYLKTIEVDKARVAAKLMIDQLRTRNFMLCYLGADYYAFVHRTFLEYFCAWEFVWQFKETQTLTIETLKREVFGKHWIDESWHEVLRLIAGMIDAKFVGQIIQYLMMISGEGENFVNLFLAAECLAEVRNRKVIISIDRQLLSKLKKLIHDGGYRESFRSCTEEDKNRIRKIRTQAIKAVTNTWKERPETFTWLENLTTTHDSSNIRCTAVRELARSWKDSSDTFTWLKERASTDRYSDVRCAALQELAYGWKDLPETLTWLKQRATIDNDSDVRCAALRELAHGWSDRPEILDMIQQCATNNDSGSVRRAAVQELAGVWKEHPKTLAIIKQCATTDDNWGVRRAAIQELARGWKDYPETLVILKQCAIADNSSSVRGAARIELARRWNIVLK
ncbi:HEAT repeat domain-containing protein [Mastigocoleus sp. MO_188.B34]|uniref:NACHT domain-containing protein n=1 Tax=Mastigocoleus sp. MO_188.B34 TaxID=3036635 RepID=UPI00261FE36C|nr:HEAT repeat domain-containing protein [Mastigocoleus sp. MO_188.B34]MDJ0697476.1 HEAT repeat domain-containing protein [Mastigocoleus sp. MO_188.B34]